MSAALRWLLFITVGLPIQWLLYLLYPVAIILFRKKWRGKIGTSFKVPTDGPRSLEQIIDLGAITKMRNEVFTDSKDDHTALVHYGTWSYKPMTIASEGLRRLVRADGSLERMYPVQTDPNPVSRDCLTSWVYSYTMFGGPKQELKKIGLHYLKHCLGLAHHNGMVSARSSSSGINYTFDGYKNLSQPAFGPNYYSSASLLALMRKEFGGVWHLVYFIHFILMGGWLWWIEPVIYNDKHLIYYDHHITLLNLTAMEHLYSSPLNRRAIRRVAVEIAPQNNINAFFYAMAWNAGVLTEKERQDAVMVLRNIAHFWPQEPATGPDYLNGRQSLENWSMMGYHAKLLKNPAKRLPRP